VKPCIYAPLSANTPASGMFKVCSPVGKLWSNIVAPPDPSLTVNTPAELPKITTCLILDLVGPTTAASSPWSWLNAFTSDLDAMLTSY